MTSAARVKRHRDRAKQGLVRVELWIPADKEQAVRDAYEAICKMDKPEYLEALIEYCRDNTP